VCWDELQAGHLAYLHVLRVDRELLGEWTVVEGELLVVATGLAAAGREQHQMLLEGR